MNHPATIILAIIVVLVTSFFCGWKTHGAWNDAVAAQAALTRPVLHDCAMPCPVPEDKAMHPHNPKGRSK